MSKLITSLLVVELRSELEKRGLDKNGVKQILIERLERAMVEEGLNPEIYLFDTNDKKTGKRLSTSSEADQEQSPDKKDDEEDIKKEKVINNTNELKSEKKNETDAQMFQENEGESLIRLTLEEEEKLHDDESENIVEATAKEEKNGDIVIVKQSQEHDTSMYGKSMDTKKEQHTVEEGNNQPVKRKSNIVSNPRILWISNVTKNTRASDIKQALSIHGKVVGAKVVVNAKFPGSLCFGYVTMGSAEDADNVIANLNNTELNGQIIKIEKFDNVRTEQLAQRQQQKIQDNRDKSTTIKQADEETSKAIECKDNKESTSKEEKIKECKENVKEDRHKEKLESGHKKSGPDHQSRDKHRTHSIEGRHRSHSGGKNDVLTFDKIREERERQRLREKERLLREESRRRHEEAIRHREIERKQRNEAQRLEREREKLRLERERIEKEKAELIRLERERQKAEREHLELEKLELERTRMRLEEDRRASKRPGNSLYKRDDSVDPKKISSARHIVKGTSPDFLSSRKVHDYEPSSQKKYTVSNKDYRDRLSYDKHDYADKRQNEYGIQRPISTLNRSSGNSSFKYDKSYDSREIRDTRLNDPSDILSMSAKESRYSLHERERDRSPHFQRDDRRDMLDGKHNPLSSRREHRYQEASRYERSSSDWSHTPSSSKAFSGSLQKNYPKQTWRPDSSGTSGRWSGQRSSSSKLPGQFSGSSNVNMVSACPPPPGINNYPDRFDYGRQLNGMKKY